MASIVERKNRYCVVYQYDAEDGKRKCQMVRPENISERESPSGSGLE